MIRIWHGIIWTFWKRPGFRCGYSLQEPRAEKSAPVGDGRGELQFGLQNSGGEGRAGNIAPGAAERSDGFQLIGPPGERRPRQGKPAGFHARVQEFEVQERIEAGV